MPNPFVHVELNTDDVAKAKKFYKSIFGWKLSDMPMGPGMVYTMIDVGGGVGGGLAPKQDPGAPNAWLSYVGVDSVKKTIAKAKKGGATILVDYMPVGGMGALGIFVDPTGATLGVWEAGKPAKKGGKKKAAAKKKGAGKKKKKK